MLIYIKYKNLMKWQAINSITLNLSKYPRHFYKMGRLERNVLHTVV